MKRAFVSSILVLMICHCAVFSGEVIPPAELQALDRAITREINTGSLGSQVLGDLTRLRSRLAGLNGSLGQMAVAPAATLEAAADPQVQLLARLQAEAAAGGRAARRSLAYYYMYLNEPEKAREQWRLMGKGSEKDVSYLLISAFLEIALGEHNVGKASLASATALLEARSPLKVSNPIFCQNVAGYRIYEPRRGNAFLPGEDVLIYVEIEGAEFADSPEGGSECGLLFGLKLKDDAQGTVWAEPNFGEYAPLFNGPIRDLHAVLTWKVPNNLEPGRFHLTVEAVENATKRRGEGITGFSVDRRPTNPEKRPSAALDASGLPAALPRSFSDMQSAFPGAPVIPDPGKSGTFEEQKLELLQRYLQGQRSE